MLWTVLLAAFAAHAQSLVLSFQLDDFYVLRAPAELFLGAREAAPNGVAPWAVRLVLWALYAALDLLPGPPNELAHRLVGLGIHVAAAVLLARVAMRAGAGAAAALFAGLLFGVGGGAAQAFTWSSAFGDALGGCFGLLAAERLLAARTAGARRARRARLAGAAALLLALLSKESLLPLAPALWVGLQCAARPTAARRARGAEAVAVFVPLVLAVFTRWAYLGSLGVRYGGFEPELAQYLAAPGQSLELLAKALVPFNGDPLVADVAAAGLGSGPFTPLLAQYGPLPFACVFALAALALALAHSPRRGLVAVVLLLLGWGCALPAGLLGFVSLHNGLARTLYVPLVFVCLALGLAIAPGARAVWRRRVELALALFWIALAVPLGVRNGQLERLASKERVAYVRTAYSLLHRPPEHGDRLFLIEPPADFAGISQLGPHLDWAVSPPFAAAHGYELRSVRDRHSLAQALEEPRREGARTWFLGPADAAVFGDSGRPPAERRAARLPVLRYLGAQAPPQTADAVLGDDGAARANFEQRPSPMGLTALELVYDGPVPVGELGILWFADGAPAASQQPTLAGGPAGSSVHVLVPHDVGLRLATAIEGLVFQPASRAPQRVRLGWAAPELEVSHWPELAIAPGAPGPTVQVAVPPGSVWPRDVRAELAFAALGGTVRLYLHGRLPERAEPGADSGPFEVHLDRVGQHVSPPLGPAGGLSFGDFALGLAARRARPTDVIEGSVFWRLELVHPDGTAAVAARPGQGRFRAGP